MTAAGGVGLCLLIGGLVLMASWRAGGPVGDAGAGQPPRSTADDRQERDQQFADDLAAMETVPRDRRPPRVEPVPPAGATALPPAGRRHALLIGVKQYTGPGVGIEYKYTERDVDEFARLLNRRWGFARADIRLQTQWAAGENPRQAPTGANIRRQLARMRAEAGPADSVLVALTGTGFQTGPAGEYHFVPEDGHPDRPDTLISQTELFAALTTCPAGVKVLVVDTCRGFQPRAVRPTPPQVPGPFAVFFGCQPGEYAMELDGLQHGVLTDAVLRGLGGAADANRDGSVTQGELDGFVRRRVGESLREVVGPDGRPHPQHPELVSGLPADTVLFAPPLESAPAGTTARPGVFGD